MAKKVNKNMVAVLTAFGFVLMTAAAIVMILQLRATDPQVFVDRAKQHAENGEYREAAMYYQRACDASGNLEYRVAAGQMNYNQGEEGKARQIWEAALIEDPTLISAHHKLLEYWLEVVKGRSSMSMWRRVKEVSEALLEVDAQDPYGLYCQGQALWELRSQDKTFQAQALAALNRAVEIAPENVDYSLALAEVQVGAKEEGDSEIAIPEDRFAVYKRLLEAHQVPGHDAYRIRVAYAERLAEQAMRFGYLWLRAEAATASAQALGDKARAAQLAEETSRREAETEEARSRALAMFEEALSMVGEQAEDQAAARVRLAQYIGDTKLRRLRSEEGKEEEANAVFEQIVGLLKEAIDIDSHGFDQYTYLADVYRAEKRFADGIAVCKERADLGIERKGLKTQERKLGLYTVQLKAADLCILQAYEEPLGNPERDEYLEQAQQFVSDAQAEFPALASGFHFEGKILLAKGKNLEAMAQFEKADGAGYNRWENKYFLATLYLAEGQLGAAREAIQQAVQDRMASHRAWVAFAQILLETNEPGAALEAANQALRRAPGDRDTLLVKAQAYRELGRPELMEQTLAELDTDDTRTAVIQARALAIEEKYNEALAILEPVLAKDPGNISALRVAVASHVAQDQRDQARALAERALQGEPDEPRLKALVLALEEGLSEEEQQKRRLAIIEEIEDAFSKNLELAQYYIGAGEMNKAMQSLAKAEKLLVDKATDDARAAYEREGQRTLREIMDRRFSLILQQAMEDDTPENLAEAEAMAELAKERNIDGVEGLTYYGRLQLLQENPTLAAESFRRALAIQSKNASTLYLLGQAYLELNQYDQARDVYLQAVEINPEHGLAHKKLALLAEASRDQEAFEEHLGKAIELLPNDEWTRTQKDRLTEINDPAAGIKRRVKLRAENPDDLDNILKLSELYVKTGQLDEAQECIETALKSGGDRLGVIVRAEAFYRMERKDTARAMEVLQQALENRTDPADRAAVYSLMGDHLQILDDLEGAEAAYRSAVDSAETVSSCLTLGQFLFSQRQYEQALEWLDKAVALTEAPDAELSDNTLTTVRSAQIDALIAMREFDRALESIKELGKLPGRSSLALLLQAQIEAQRGEVEKAIEDLGVFIEKHPTDRQGRYRRARLYAGVGKWQLAILDLERLKAHHPDAFEYRPRLLLARAYDLTGRTDLAVTELKTLLDQDPQNSSTAQALITTYREHDQLDEALRMAVAMANRQPQQPYWLIVQAEIAMAREEKDCKRALELLNQAFEVGKRTAPLAARVLAACDDCQAYDQGIAFFEQQVPQDQRGPAVVRSYAALLARKGRETEAVQQYRLAAAQQPELQSGVIGSIATSALDTLGAEKALELFRKPPEDERLQRANRFIVAMMLDQQDSHSEAGAIMAELLGGSTADNEKIGLGMQAAIIANRGGEFDKAKKYYEDVLKLAPEHWGALNNLAYLLSDELGQHKTALPYAEKAAELSGDPNVLDTLGSIYLELGEARKAIARLTQAIEDKPDLVAAYVHLADAYRRLEDFARAQDLLNQAQTLNKPGSDNDYSDRIAELQEKVGNQDSGS